MSEPVILYSFAGRWDLRSVSPFCAKTQVYLELAKIPHTVKGCDPRKAPKGKAPYIHWQGKDLGDSSFIQKALIKEFGDPLDSGLSAAQKAQGHLMRVLCEEHLYWVIVRGRWMEDAGFTVMAPGLKKMVPALLAPILVPMIRKGVLKSLKGQGMGLHTWQEAVSLGLEDLAALDALLALTPFAVSDQPTSYDTSVYPFLKSIAQFPGMEEVKAGLTDGLRAYIQRMDDFTAAL